jgi:glycogen debranching enzyme
MVFFARDMVRIASELRDTTASERYWADRGRIQTAINDNLWDDASGFYYDLRSDGTFVRDKSYTGLVPLIAGVVPAERIPVVLSALRDPRQFLSSGGIRSMSAASPDYIPGEAGKGVNSNWRGPVWMPINYLLIQRITDLDPPFAEELRGRLVDTVEQDWRATGRLHEYFDGDTATGLGADDQAGWTALVANLIREGWPAQP